MKVILTPNDQAVAIQAFLIETYNIATVIDESQLTDMQIDLDPTISTASLMHPTEPSTALLKEVIEEDTRVEREYNEDTDAQEDYRDRVIKEAESLGIKFRSDIKTETLEERIDEYSQEREALLKEANDYGLHSLEHLTNDDIQAHINDQIELNKENDTEVFYNTEEDEEEAVPVPQVASKKRSIFGN